MVSRYLDRTNKTGDLTGTWTFTNGSPNVNAPGTDGAALTEIAVGDYVKPDGTNEWYYVSSITDDDNFVLTEDFTQTTQTNVTTNYADESTNDGSTTGLAFVHPDQFFVDEVRSAGDILYMRRAQTHLLASHNLTMDENGVLDNHVIVMSDDGTGWAGETGNADTIFDLDNQSIQFNVNAISYWEWQDFEIKNGTSSRLIQINGAYSWWKDMVIHGCNGAYGVFFPWNESKVWMEDCTIYDASNSSSSGCIRWFGNAGYLSLKRCSIYDGARDGINGVVGLVADIENSVFGDPIPNAFLDITGGGIFRTRDCTYNSSGFGTANIPGNGLFMMDYDDTKHLNQRKLQSGIIDRITGTVRSGGATSSIQAVPHSVCSDDLPFIIYEIWIYNADETKTYEIYMQATGTWAALPDATTLYIEALYFNDANSGRTTMVSDEVISSEDTWTKFELPSVNPSDVGPIRLRVYLKKYESGKKILVDPLVVIS